MQVLNREETISSRHPAAAPLMLGALDRISLQASQAARTYVSARNLVIETLLVKLRYERYDVTRRICYLKRLASSHQENEMSSAKEPGHPQGSQNRLKG
jgi:hypothetical protein